MRLCVTLLINILIGGFSYGQGKTKQDLFKPFTVLIIKPDSAKITDSLIVFAGSMEKEYVDRHYSSIRSLDKLRELGRDEPKKRTDLEIQKIKSREMDAYNFRYYHTVANQTLFELSILFNTNYWEKNFSSKQTILEGYLVDRAELFTYDLEELGKYYKVDYIITFEDIHSGTKKELEHLIIQQFFFGPETKKIILRKEVEGNAPVENYKFYQDIFSFVSNEDKFHDSEIHCDNYLECMFKSAVRFSTEDLFKAIAKKQKK